MPEPEVVLYHATFVTGEDYATQAARAFMLFQLRRPLVWIQIGLPLIAIPVLSTAFSQYPYSFAVALGIDLLILVANLISWTTRRRNLANRLAATTPPGSLRELSMTDTTISLGSGDSFGRSPYRHFESADSFGDFVFVRLRGSSIRTIVPRELFTDESLAFLRSRVA